MCLSRFNEGATDNGATRFASRQDFDLLTRKFADANRGSEEAIAELQQSFGSSSLEMRRKLNCKLEENSALVEENIALRHFFRAPSLRA
jgi:hypothetical protein